MCESNWQTDTNVKSCAVDNMDLQFDFLFHEIYTLERGCAGMMTWSVVIKSVSFHGLSIVYWIDKKYAIVLCYVQYCCWAFESLNSQIISDHMAISIIELRLPLHVFEIYFLLDLFMKRSEFFKEAEAPSTIQKSAVRRLHWSE